jgi:hypothetical protein
MVALPDSDVQQASAKQGHREINGTRRPFEGEATDFPARAGGKSPRRADDLFTGLKQSSGKQTRSGEAG